MNECSASGRTSGGSVASLKKIMRTAVALLLAVPTTTATGRIPTTLPTSTTILDIGNGGFTGTIPTELGLLTELTRLNLKRNSLEGAIPTELGNTP